jgi:hypothetical protein
MRHQGPWKAVGFCGRGNEYFLPGEALPVKEESSTFTFIEGCHERFSNSPT